MAVVGNRRIRDKAGSRNMKGTARGDDFQISKAQKQLDALNAKINKASGKPNIIMKRLTKDYKNQKKQLEAKIRDLRGVAKMDLKKNPLKINKRGMTPPRTLAKGESKVSQSNMMKGKAPASANPQPKKKKALPKRATRMGQMAYGGKVKKMKSGGKVSRRDGCAVRGKTKGRMV